jgi:NTP pyrophosphatase (non-canonical NTP hydrolase)
MEAALDVRPGDGRWVKGFAGPALSPRLKHGQLFLELIGPPGPKRGLTVKGSTLWDIVEEVSPPSWATPDAAPDAYQRQVLATWGAAGGSFTAQLLPAVLGLVGEAGEVADLIKKQLFKPGTVRDNAAVIDELADVAYYLAVLASLYGVTFDGLFAHLAGKLAGGHGWVNPSNSTGLEVGHE